MTEPQFTEYQEKNLRHRYIIIVGNGVYLGTSFRSSLTTGYLISIQDRTPSSMPRKGMEPGFWPILPG